MAQAGADLDRGTSRLRLGFACVWDADPRRTWSYTAWDLREALRRRADVDVIDVGIEVPAFGRRLLQLASLRRRSGRWVTPWEHLRAWEVACQAYLDRRALGLGCDAVLQIQDLGVMKTPYFVYQDLSYDIILALLAAESEGLRRYFPHLDAAGVARRRSRQLRVYEGAGRVFTMSHFLRRSLIEHTGLAPGKVQTVHPGAVAGVPTDFRSATAVSRPKPRRRLLFAGTTFDVKGGDAVVAALQLLRREDSQVALTVVGPAKWPLPGEPPPGCHFIGRVDPAAMPGLYDRHDVLVVPSRLEGFGKVFVEALTRGLPCVGRDAFAMPELIRDGENGALVRTESPAELADCIARVLADDGIYERCLSGRDELMAHFTWDRAASEMVDAIREASGTKARRV
jgi:glycosyltransferase involved in cell wall biosynthesis